jgi:alkylation response protein AidB-like acyl-CoA dehydrogenase
VRITRIYEGTSEIMEMTISRDRWQLHLKTKGQYYHDKAREAEALHATHPNVGADVAALALHALSELMEKARVHRLTRFQHILFRIGEWIAYAECALTLAKRAALFADGRQHEKANDRFDATALSAISRIFAREAAIKVAQDGLKCITGAGGAAHEEVPLFEAALSMSAIHRAQQGLIDDMDYVADVLYNRVKKASEVKQPVLA